MFWLKLLVSFLLFSSVLLNVLASWCGRTFIKRSGFKLPALQARPPISLLVPVCGIEGEGLKHFSRFCCLDWPDYQVVFAVLDPADVAIPILRQIQPMAGCDMRIQVGGNAEGANLKIRNLINAFPFAIHDWIVICDADIEPEPNFFEGLIRPFNPSSPEKEEIGMVHSLYRCMDDTTEASSWENVWINCDFWVQGLLGDWLRGTDFAFGAAMAFRRSTLEEIGGLATIRDYLADDYQLGNRVSKLGKRLVFNTDFVTLKAGHQTWSEVWGHLMRWSRTIRVCQPVGFAGSIVTNMTLMALVAVIVDFPFFYVISGLVLILRVILANQCRNWILNRTGLWNRWWLILFKDVAQIALWVLAFWNGSIEWRGTHYILNREGKLIYKPVST